MKHNAGPFISLRIILCIKFQINNNTNKCKYNNKIRYFFKIIYRCAYTIFKYIHISIKHYEYIIVSCNDLMNTKLIIIIIILSLFGIANI